jgi:hypothetical protein
MLEHHKEMFPLDHWTEDAIEEGFGNCRQGLTEHVEDA